MSVVWQSFEDDSRREHVRVNSESTFEQIVGLALTKSAVGHRNEGVEKMERLLGLRWGRGQPETLLNWTDTLPPASRALTLSRSFLGLTPQGVCPRPLRGLLLVRFAELQR
jgi:hypothetical protein